MKINYVVAFYIASEVHRTNVFWKSDYYYALKLHLKQLETLNLPDITKATFVLNNEDPHILENMKKIISQEYNNKIPIELKSRKNWGRSYGAWEYQLRSQLYEDFDYYFVIEDDFFPAKDEFYKYFIDKVDDNTGMVCQLYNGHPVISNSLIVNTACKHIYEKYGEIFFGYNEFSKNPYVDRYKVSQDIYEYNHPTGSGPYDLDWQSIYHKHFLDTGYLMKDVSDIACNRFRVGLNIMEVTSQVNFVANVVQKGETLILPMY